MVRTTRATGARAWAVAAAALAAAACSSNSGDPGASKSAAPAGWPNPTEACAYLDGRGYRNHGYKAYNPVLAEQMTCQSLNRKVGGGTAVVGEAGFYYSVVGAPDRAEHMRLRVDLVKGGADEQRALDEFAETAAELSQKAFHAPLPEGAAAALKAGEAGKWPIEGGHELVVTRLKEQGGPFGHVYQVVAELR